MFNSEDETLHTLHQWIPLSSGRFVDIQSHVIPANVITKIDARGYVHFNDYESYDLSEPYTVSLNHTHDGPGYMLSAFHQLHCLVRQTLKPALTHIALLTSPSQTSPT
jgi:hypothetical protein